MSGLDAKYFAAFNIEEVILDKDTAFPLAGGLVSFYKDQARSQLKTIYQLVSGPGGYTYTPLPNPIVLSSIGTFQDNSGNDVVPYLNPYDDHGNLELYYVTVYSSLDGVTPAVFQFDREAVPSDAVVEESQTAVDIKNYISDGQFLLHTNVPSTSSTTVTGEITQPVTILSQGGWSYERSAATTSKDAVVFNPIASAVTVPSSNPKWTCNPICYVPDATAAFKALRIKFNDVNKFAGTQQYTIAFTAKSNSGPTLLNVNLIKNFGTGGSPSPSTSTSIASDVTIATSFQAFSFHFAFGDNLGKTLGTNGDDYLQIEFSFPPNAAFNMEFTDFALISGAETVTTFPVMTNAEMLYGSISGWADVPAHDGSNLYLPLILSPQGLTYDTSQIGKVYATINSSLGKGELYADGSQYETSKYSTDGIPYSRLQNVLWKSSIQTPIAGTGLNYMTAIHNGTTFDTLAEMIIANNSAGTVTSANDGTVPTGFGISNTTVGSASTSFVAYNASATAFLIENFGTGGSASAGTTGFYFTGDYTDHSGLGGTSYIAYFDTSVVTPSSLAGKYFTYNTGSAAYYVWYQVDGAGSDPAPGGRGILINLLSAFDTTNTVMLKSFLAVTGQQITRVSVTKAGSLITPGSYFNIYTTANQFYVWYKVGGVGTDPTVLGAIGIEVDILSTDTAVQVASKTQSAINMMYFAVPDLRGAFLRGTGGSVNGYDVNAIYRFSNVPGYIGDIPNTFEYDQNLVHTHTGSITVPVGPAGTPITGGLAAQTSATVPGNITINYDGTGEARPYNASVIYIIKY
jgi:hypothetical protein